MLAEALYQDVKKCVKREDVFICPNGIPATLGDASVAERYNAVHRLLFLSNLLETKGVYVLLDALTILKERGYSFICDFVGGETTEIDIKKFSEEVEKRGLSEFAIYLGKKYGEEKNEEYAKSDIFVFPTFYPNECFPLVLLEAMQQGLPCISTNEGGIASIIDDGKTGFLVEKQNPVQLADMIEMLLKDRELREDMGIVGKEKFEQEFTLSKFEERIGYILSRCIKLDRI